MDEEKRVTIEVDLNYFNDLVDAALECADDLEVELQDRYPSRSEQPVQQRRFVRDMQPVLRLRVVAQKLRPKTTGPH